MFSPTRRSYIPGIVIGCILSVTFSRAQTVVRYPGLPKPLADRWQWAREEASNRGFDNGYWIGYSIERLMGERSMVGCYSSDRQRNRPTLAELIAGMKQEHSPGHADLSGTFPADSGVDLGD